MASHELEGGSVSPAHNSIAHQGDDDMTADRHSVHRKNTRERIQTLYFMSGYLFETQIKVAQYHKW